MEVLGTYKVADQDYVEELQRADDDEESHECIEELDALRRLGHVFAVYALQDILCVCVA